MIVSGNSSCVHQPVCQCVSCLLYTTETTPRLSKVKAGRRGGARRSLYHAEPDRHYYNTHTRHNPGHNQPAWCSTAAATITRLLSPLPWRKRDDPAML
ncbi:hypothetical protein DPEC_G00224640 [Dallia pectoralis]|uniref:Uncharacterized protein n=1 Tax=Dallia pectoralis TaxID=75939 RepID=A0ACC2G0D8_DALPE|nr:hypothetical protein DPEC_G00224640 [Dallia pectoralis]